MKGAEVEMAYHGARPQLTGRMVVRRQNMIHFVVPES